MTAKNLICLNFNMAKPANLSTNIHITDHEGKLEVCCMGGLIRNSPFLSGQALKKSR